VKLLFNTNPIELCKKMRYLKTNLLIFLLFYIGMTVIQAQPVKDIDGNV